MTSTTATTSSNLERTIGNTLLDILALGVIETAKQVAGGSTRPTSTQPASASPVEAPVQVVGFVELSKNEFILDGLGGIEHYEDMRRLKNTLATLEPRIRGTADNPRSEALIAVLREIQKQVRGLSPRPGKVIYRTGLMCLPSGEHDAVHITVQKSDGTESTVTWY